MFATFLLGTVLVSLAALAALLAAPRPVGAPGALVGDRQMPWVGLVVVVLVAALAFLGGLAMGA